MSRAIWPDDFAEWQANVERRLHALTHASQLGNSSIEDGKIETYDGGGTLRGISGTQADGTVTHVDVNGGAPPVPTEPSVLPVAQGFNVGWDGTYAGGAVSPMDWSKLLVHASTDLAFDADTPDTIIGTIASAAGGMVSHTAPDYSEYAVRLVAVNTSGAMSAPSAPAFVTPLPVTEVDIEDLSLTVKKFHTTTHLFY